MALLLFETGGSVGRFPVGAGPVVVGRSRRAMLRIEDALVSGLHARIAPLADGALTIEDLGSRNGTRVNGRRIEAGRPVRIAVSDEIGIGQARVVVAGDELHAEDRTVSFARPAVRAAAPAVDARAFLEDAAGFAHLMAERRGVHLAIQADPRLSVRLDPLGVAAVVRVLALGAVRQAAEGSLVVVSACAEGRDLHLAVESTSGGPIDVSAARRHVEVHGGDVRVESGPRGGCLVTLTLRAAVPEGAGVAA